MKHHNCVLSISSLLLLYASSLLLSSSCCNAISAAFANNNNRKNFLTRISQTKKPNMADKKIKLTYFDIEGAAECVRLAFALAGVDYEDVRIKGADWKDLKPKMPYGQLPILQVGEDGPMQTQSMAILRWVGSSKSASLYPAADPQTMYAIEEALGVLDDLKASWAPCLYISMKPHVYGHDESLKGTDELKSKVKAMRETWVKDTFPVFAGYLEGLLAKNDNQWLASSGSGPTIADCVAVPFLRSFTKGHVDHVPTTLLDGHPKLVDYVKRFCALPAIQGRYKDGLHE